MSMDKSNAEFRRQIRSLFALLRAIVRRSAEGEISKNDYAAQLEGRIGALARAHDMLMRAPDDGVDLEELTHGELLAQAVPDRRYKAIGPDTRLGREAVMPMALALHELAMNALIHGAFGARGGHLDVTWEHLFRSGRKWLRVFWQESGMHIQGHPPTAKGFGLELIEKTLPYELGACNRVAWAPQGVQVEILLPSEAGAVFWRPGDRVLP